MKINNKKEKYAKMNNKNYYFNGYKMGEKDCFQKIIMKLKELEHNNNNYSIKEIIGQLASIKKHELSQK